MLVPWGIRAVLKAERGPTQWRGQWVWTSPPLIRDDVLSLQLNYIPVHDLKPPPPTPHLHICSTWTFWCCCKISLNILVAVMCLSLAGTVGWTVLTHRFSLKVKSLLLLVTSFCTYDEQICGYFLLVFHGDGNCFYSKAVSRGQEAWCGKKGCPLPLHTPFVMSSCW